MKATLITSSILILTFFALAFLSNPVPHYGKGPAFVLAAGLSTLTTFVATFILGIILKDKILLFSGASVFAAAIISVIAVCTHTQTNAFGAFWGGLSIICAFGLIGFLTSIGRLLFMLYRYKSTSP